jgi:hypothetical protein
MGDGGDASSGSDAELLAALKSKLTAPPPVETKATGFWGGLFGLTIPPAAGESPSLFSKMR